MTLDSLRGRICTEVVRWEYSWLFVFDEGWSLTVECPWRIVAGGRIAVAHSDHEQWFGLPEPVDVPSKAMSLLSGQVVRGASIRPETSDLFLEFNGANRLELLNDSSGYECWQLSGPNGEIWVGINA